MLLEDNLRIAAFPHRRDINRNVIVGEIQDLIYSFFPKLYERRKQRGELLSGGNSRCWWSDGH
jgi:branched-chain amino acid transport system ATP-binding protein